jgi:hypothetical protein
VNRAQQGNPSHLRWPFSLKSRRSSHVVAQHDDDDNDDDDVRSNHIHLPLVRHTYIHLHRSARHPRVTQKGIGASEGRLLSSTPRSLVACAARRQSARARRAARDERIHDDPRRSRLPRFTSQSFYTGTKPNDDGSFPFSRLRVVLVRAYQPRRGTRRRDETLAREML